MNSLFGRNEMINVLQMHNDNRCIESVPIQLLNMKSLRYYSVFSYQTI